MKQRKMTMKEEEIVIKKEKWRKKVSLLVLKEQKRTKKHYKMDSDQKSLDDPEKSRSEMWLIGAPC